LWDSVADMAFLLAAIVALLPLIIAPHWLLYFDVTPKIVLMLVGAAIALPLAERGQCVLSPGLRIFGWLLSAQAVSLAISTWTSVDPALSLGGGTWRRFGLVTQYAMLAMVSVSARYMAAQTDCVRIVLRALAASGVAAAIYGILQYFGWDPWIDPAAYHIGEAPFTIVRPPGTMGYVSYFAVYLLAVIFAGLALAVIKESRLWKILGAAAAALGTAALLLTGTRAATLGLLGGAALLAFWAPPRIRIRIAVAGTAAIVALAFFYFSPPGQLLRSRVRWFIEDPLGGGRPLLWRDSVRMAAARLPMGFGPDTFSLEFPKHQSPELARAYPHLFQESAHNIFLDALVEQGTPGLVILFGLTVLGFYAAWKSPNRSLAAPLGATLAALLISQQFSAFTLPTAFFYYLTIAILVAQAFPPESSSLASNRARMVAWAAVSLVFVAFAVALAASDATLARISRLTHSGNVRQAAAAYQQFERWKPPGMQADLWYSRTMAESVDRPTLREDQIFAVREAVAAAVRASRTAEDRQNAWLNLAAFYARQNDLPHTEQSLRAAIGASPAWFKPHWLLAQVLRAGGRLKEARDEAAIAADLDGGKDPQVARTLTEIRSAVHP